MEQVHQSDKNGIYPSRVILNPKAADVDLGLIGICMRG